MRDNLVSALEEYCKKLFETSEFKDIKSDEFEKGLSNCKVKFEEIKRLIDDLPVKKMVAVFLPYMASMWDCLDSVCREAMQDPDWEVFVMPVPYYTLDPQHRVESDNCEINLFSNDLPLLNYKDVSLKDLSPDLIFYHNPYDDLNLVTRVHSEFYSRNLIEITRNLVYIPYYVSEDRTMSHMVDLPGVKNARWVVVQEELKEQFLEKYSQEKVLALGSPKIDALFNVHTENIPNEWKKKIDGKTVLFFNSHLTSAMIEPHKFFELIYYLIDLLKCNKEIVILWRPHPLFMQTLKSFNNDKTLKNKYKKCIQEFTCLENAIFDETADLHRSIAISDAYIGSMKSSVMRLYKLTGKPIYIIPDVYEKKWWETKCFCSNEGGVYADGYIWQFDFFHNALYKFHVETNVITYVATLSRYEYNEARLFWVSELVDDWLILTPGTKNNVVLFNVKTLEEKYIELEENNFKDYTFAKSITIEDSIYLVKKNSNEYFYKISLNNYKCIKQPYNAPGELVGLENGFVWLLDEKNSKLSAINLRNNSRSVFDVHKTLTTAERLYINSQNNSLWICLRSSGVLLYWKDAQQRSSCSVYKIYPNCETNGDTYITLCHVADGDFIFGTTETDAIYCCNIEKNTYEVISNPTDSNSIFFSHDAIDVDESFYIMPFCMTAPQIIKVNKFDLGIEKINCRLSNHLKMEKQIINKIDKDPDDLHKNYYPISIESWIDKIKCKLENTYKTDKFTLVGCGIWQNITKYII